jgi:acetylglutamate kinase
VSGASALAAFRGHWFVVKLGGELVGRGKLDGVAEALKACVDCGVKVAIVHGGGPQATALTKRLGLEPKQIGGRRVTDDAVLQVMKQTLAGEVSVDLAAEVRRIGLRVLPLHGVAGGLIEAVKRPPRVITGGPPEPVDLGHVGDVTGVNVDLLESIASIGWIPAVASIGADAQGNVFNINADVVAARMAAALKASKLLLVAAVGGVYEDPRRPETRLPRLTPTTAKARIASGVIAGGMIPKVEEALDALAAGIGAVHVVGAGKGELLAELEQPGATGTAFQRE